MLLHNARREAAHPPVDRQSSPALIRSAAQANQWRRLHAKLQQVIIDEGHHIEDAATSLFSNNCRQEQSEEPCHLAQKPAPSIRSPSNISTTKVRPTASSDKDSKNHGLLPPINEVWSGAEDWFQQIARLSRRTKRQPKISLNLCGRAAEPTIRSATGNLGHYRIACSVSKTWTIFQNKRAERTQPLLNLKRSRRRLANRAAFLGDYLNIGTLTPPSSTTRLSGGLTTQKTAPRCHSTCANRSWSHITGKVFMPPGGHSLSATMTVDRSFEHFTNRVGIDNILLPYTSGIFPSPFDYPNQAVLALPNDIPFPTQAQFIERCSDLIIQSIQACNGGVFILCTSYGMLRKLHGRVSAALGRRYRIFRQGEMGRMQLLDAFLNAPNGVLFGADSFWEGVSIKGDQLRMVIIPRLPFRVPTAPVEQARHEHIQASGKNPFRVYSLPQACLRFRQGFGRSSARKPTKAVVIMDSRINTMWYGKTFINPYRQSDYPWQQSLSPRLIGGLLQSESETKNRRCEWTG